MRDPVGLEEEERGGLTARRLSRRQQLFVVTMVTLLAIAGAVFGPQQYASWTARTADRQAEDAISASAFRPTAQQWAGFVIAPIKEQTFRDVHETDGVIAIDDDLNTAVISPYSGRVTRLFAKAGDEVGQDAPLFAVAATEFVQAQNDLIAAASTLHTARAQLNLAQTNEKRQHDLYLAQGAALKDWQQSQVDLANAQGGFANAQIALAAVRNRLRILGKSDNEIHAIETAPEPLNLAPDAVVSAPISGTIISRQIGLGQNIVSAASGGSTVAMQIGNLAKVWLIANAREADAPRMHVGDPVEVRVMAFPERLFRAKLTYVGASLDPNTHRLPVRAEVENPDRVLKPQMFASFTIITGAGTAAAAVPESAVVYEGDSAHVWVARSDKTLELRSLRIGRTADGMVQALEGVRVGESVVTSGSVFIDRAARSD